MDDGPVRLRCPGCGQVKEVPMSVGQQLRCDTCHTSFIAPILGTAGQQLDDALDSSVSAIPRHEPSRETLTNSASDRSDRGVSLTDSTKTHAWSPDDLVSKATERTELPPPTEPVDAPPSSAQINEDVCGIEPSGQSGKPLPDTPERLDRDANDHERDRDVSVSGGRRSGLIFALVSLAVLGTGLAVLAFKSLSESSSSVPERNVSERSVPHVNDSGAEVHWTDASRSSQKRRQIVVRVVRVVRGPIRVKNLASEVIVTDGDDLLAVTLSIRNDGSRPRPFHSWFEHSFQTPEGVDVPIELVDDLGHVYFPVNFEDVSRVVGQRWAEQIDPNERLQDVLVFGFPPDIDLNDVGFFRLSLPAAAVELSDRFRFQIPATMVEASEIENSQ